MKRVIGFIIVITGFALALPYFFYLPLFLLYLMPDIYYLDFWQSEEEKTPRDYEAAKKVIEYIGAEEVIEKDFMYDARIRVDNDTLYGQRRYDNYFFIQSLTDTSYFVDFIADTSVGPKHLYQEPGRTAKTPMLFFFYQKNGCIYFGGRRQQIEKLCKDGSYEPILTEEALDKRKGPVRVGGLIHWNGKIVQTTNGGNYIFDKETGEMIWKWYYEPLNNGGFIIVGDRLVFNEKINDQDKNKIVALNLRDLEIEWETEIPEKISRGLRTNYEDVVVFHGRTKGMTYFLDAYTGEIIYETKYQTALSYNSDFFSTVRDDYAFLKMDGGIGKYNFREGELIWKKEESYMAFPYKNWVVLKARGETRAYDQFLVVDRQTGEGEIVSQIDGSHPSIDLHDRYIQVRNTIYK